MGRMGVRGFMGIIGFIGIGGDAWESVLLWTFNQRTCGRTAREPVDVQSGNLWTYSQGTCGRTAREPVDVQPRIGREHHDAAQSWAALPCRPTAICSEAKAVGSALKLKVRHAAAEMGVLSHELNSVSRMTAA